MSSILHRDPKTLVPDFIEWFEEPFLTMRPYLGHAIRVEDYTEDGRYVIRAEIAGIDPEEGARGVGRHRLPRDPRGAVGQARGQAPDGVQVRLIQPHRPAPARRRHRRRDHRVLQRHPDHQARPQGPAAGGHAEGPGHRRRDLTVRCALRYDGLDQLFDAIRRRGFRLVGPVRRDGAICYGDIASAADLACRMD